jgi:hypothetical protein
MEKNIFHVGSYQRNFLFLVFFNSAEGLTGVWLLMHSVRTVHESTTYKCTVQYSLCMSSKLLENWKTKYNCESKLVGFRGKVLWVAR